MSTEVERYIIKKHLKRLLNKGRGRGRERVVQNELKGRASLLREWGAGDNL